MSGKYKKQDVVRQEEVYDVSQLGSGLTIASRQSVEFTHKEACHLLELDEFHGDRKLKERHVSYLIRTMMRGTFHPEWVTLITCSVNGNTFRMNGQHTAWARLEMPKGWKCPVEMIHYLAKTEQDMRMLYASIDRSSPRTKANVTDSYLVGSEEFNDVKGRTLRVVPHGFNMWFWQTPHERSKHDGDDIAYLLKTDHLSLALKVCAFLDKVSPREHSHVFRGPVVAAMFATFKKAPQIAEQFWSPVADGVGMEKRGDPRLRLRTWLIQSAVNSGGGGGSTGKQKVSQELMYRQCIGCWNAHRESRGLQYLRANERGKRTHVK
jgi:hypothetical protein